MVERHFDQQLNELKAELLKTASAVEASIGEAIQALVDRNDQLAQKVIDDGKMIDHMEVEVEEHCLALFALRQPMASDLRLLGTFIRINTDLERINDQAVNIAERALELNKVPLLKPLIDIPRMAGIARSMVKDSLDAFVNRDADLADDVRRRDDEIDNLNDQVFRELLTYMMQDPTTIPCALHLLLIGRHLERIGDHASNISEGVVYIMKGRIVRHQKEGLLQ